MHNGYLKTLKKRIPESEGEGEGKTRFFSTQTFDRHPLSGRNTTKNASQNCSCQGSKAHSL